MHWCGSAPHVSSPRYNHIGRSGMADVSMLSIHEGRSGAHSVSVTFSHPKYHFFSSIHCERLRLEYHIQPLLMTGKHSVSRCCRRASFCFSTTLYPVAQKINSSRSSGSGTSIPPLSPTSAHSAFWLPASPYPFAALQSVPDGAAALRCS